MAENCTTKLANRQAIELQPMQLDAMAADACLAVDRLPQQCKGSALVAGSKLPLVIAQEFFSNIIDVNEIYTIGSMD